MGISKLLLHSGADLGFTERRAAPSIKSLKQGVWGAQPSEAIGYLILFKVLKSHDAYTDTAHEKLY